MNPFSSLLDLIAPRECHICATRLLKSEKFLCQSCIENLPETGYELYWNNLSSPNSSLNPFEQRFAGQLPLVHGIAPFFYSRDSSVASLVHDFKYRGFPHLAVTLGAIGASRLSDSGIFNGVEILLPVPLHWAKLIRRGYNQTEMIARGISSITGIPIGNHLRARKPHRTQTSLSSERRIANTKGVFALRHPEEIRGMHIMIVDDICTTGATLLSAGESIVEALGNDVRISLFTLGVV